MRPERLELEGFTAFRAPTVVDFAEVDLFAFMGPTGAGKSSLIDAVIFALYGSVPRYANKNLVAPVIAQQATEARVHLTFSVEGARYVVVRVVRATTSGGATTKEARLERHGPEGEVEVLAGDADGVTAAVEGLLGLSYEHFTTCVVLPQGQFARFLLAKPSERQDLLVRLLGLGVYGRMARLAGERQAGARARREVLAATLAELAPLVPAQRAELAARLDGLAELVAAIDASRARLDELADAEAAAVARQGEAQRAANALGRVARPKGVAGLAASLESARAGENVAAAQLSEAEGALDVAEQDAARAPQLAALDADLERWATRDALAGRLERGGEVVAERAEAMAAARAVLEEAESQARAAHEALEAARALDRAASLAEGLEVGDPCPVCGHPLDEVPEHRSRQLAAAGRGAEAAAATLGAARGAADDATREHARYEALLHERRTQLHEADAAVRSRPAPEDLAASRKEAEATTAAVEGARASLL
ncbi:MAG: AAA family ATPase, partial [Acidimicrobiia bacterium]|nr:AAA family ATPase [Acidimicrobiia bacterium]